MAVALQATLTRRATSAHVPPATPQISHDALFTSAAAIERTDLVQRLTSRGFQRGRPRRALVEMMPADQRGDLWLVATRSPLFKASGVRFRVQVDRDLFPLIED